MAKHYNTSKGELIISDGYSGKMDGMCGISTTALCNGNCQKFRKIDGCVCQHCFAVKLRKGAREAYTTNFNTLTNGLIDIEEMPLLNYAYFRIESHGDLFNVTQAQNYLRLIKKNPHVTFGWWTKSPRLIAEALKAEGMSKPPKNVNIVQSGFFLNKEIKPAYDWVDKVFIVYDEEHAKNVNINCGARSCLTCQRCYKKNTAKVVREKLK